MSSRKDAVAAYSHTVRRLRSGMLHGDPDVLDPGSGRTWRGLLGGIVLALVVGAIVAVIGLVKPGGGDGWRVAGTLVVVEDTGARYLYADGALHPVLNETSARLLAGKNLRVDTVTAGDLRGAEQGAPLGIVGAPDAAPDAASLERGTWLACAVNATAAAGTDSTRLVARIGDSGVPGTGLTVGRGVLVRTADARTYLVWSGRRLAVDAEAQAALGWAGAAVTPVPVGFVNALPAGPDLVATPPAGLGRTGGTVAGSPRLVGQLFRDPGGQGYVLTTQGMQRVSAVRLALLRANADVQRLAYRGTPPRVIDAGAGDVASATGTPEDDAMPATPPRLVTVPTGDSLCGVTRPRPDALITSVTIAAQADVLRGAVPIAAQPGVRPGCENADLVAVPPGRGTLVATRAGTGAAGGAYLVADTGVKYPVPPAGLSRLGYSDGAALPLPSALLRLLPTGPALDPVGLARSGVVAAPTSAATCGG